MNKCIYCGKETEEHLHFQCDCGAGMCNDCYEEEKEHDKHLHLVGIDEVIIDKETKMQYENDYICYDCMDSKVYHFTETEYENFGDELLLHNLNSPKEVFDFLAIEAEKKKEKRYFLNILHENEGKFLALLYSFLDKKEVSKFEEEYSFHFGKFNLLKKPATFVITKIEQEGFPNIYRYAAIYCVNNVWTVEIFKKYFPKEDFLDIDGYEKYMDGEETEKFTFGSGEDAIKFILKNSNLELIEKDITFSKSEKEAINSLHFGKEKAAIIMSEPDGEKEPLYFIVYNSMDNAYDFGLLTQKKLSFEKAVQTIIDDAGENINIDEIYGLINQSEQEIGQRFYRIVLVQE